jgi:hypothetical protein
MLLRLLRPGWCIRAVVAEVALHAPRIIALASLSCDMIGMCLANIVLPLFSVDNDDPMSDGFHGQERLRLVVQKWIALLTFMIPLVSLMAGDLDHFKKTCPEIFRITFGTSSLLDAETGIILDATSHIVDNHILHAEMVEGSQGSQGSHTFREEGIGAWNAFSQVLAYEMINSIFGLVQSKALSQWTDVVLFMMHKSSLMYENGMGSNLTSFLKLKLNRLSSKNPMFLETHVEKLTQLINVLPASQCDAILEVVSDALARYTSFSADVECILFVEVLISLGMSLPL